MPNISTGINLDSNFLNLKAIEIKPTLARYIFEPIYSPLDNKEPFIDIMYNRLIGLIQMIDKDMFDKAEKCNYEDDTIGVI